MKMFLKYLKERLPLLLAQIVAFGIFFEFLYSGKIYTMSLGELIALAGFLLAFCVLLYTLWRHDEHVKRNSDCVPKQ